MTTVNMFEAKNSLSRLVADVENGVVPEVIIARGGRPAARIVPLAPGPAGQRIGVARGAFVVGDVDADEDAAAALLLGDTGSAAPA